MAVHGQLTVAAILVAAGSGERLGAAVPKAFVTIAGRTLLEHAAATFLDSPRVRDVIVVAPPGMVQQARTLVAEATTVAGGQTRQQSVSHGLSALADDIDVVLVHDVARAFAPPDLIVRVIDGLAVHGAKAAVPVMPLTDTIRRADPATGDLHETVDRSALTAVQTPQAFWRADLVAAHEHASPDATDDASLIETQGGRVVGVRGDTRAFKVTVPFDLIVAEALLASTEALTTGAAATMDQ